MTQMTPEQREERLIQTLMTTWARDRQHAEGILAGYVANELAKASKEFDDLENPYRRNSSRLKWSTGVVMVTSMLFRREMRLWAKMSRADAGHPERTAPRT
jgi:hypothetical protein